jgi:glutaredoxin-like protein
VRDILMVSARDSGLHDETREFLAQLEKPVRLQVFVTPTCPYCPQTVVLAHQMAYESDLVESEMIEVMEFPEMADQYGVTGVPHTVVNDGAGEIIGSVPESALVSKIQQLFEDEAW